MPRRPQRLTAGVVRRAGAARRLLVASDYDGTLAPIVDDPAAAHPDPRAVAALGELAALPATVVAVISGRSRSDLLRFVGEIPGAVLVGGHGGEWQDGSSSPAAAALAARLVEVAGGFPGAHVEPKPSGAALHYRHVDPERADAAARSAVAAAAPLATRVVHGKMVVDFSTSDADKGAALRAIRDRVSPDVTMFVGDDITDEDAFMVLGDVDVGVKVGEGPTSARWWVDTQREVADVLDQLVAGRRGATRRG